MSVDALAVGREHRIEEAEEQLRIGIVVGRDCLLVGIDLPEQQRLDETPGRDQRMTVVERGAQGKRLQHVAFNVDIALQIGLGDVAFVERAQRPERPLIAQADVKLGLALAHAPLRTVRQLEGERRNDSAHTIDEGVESRCGR
jgi:hypothetical protein